MIGTPPCRGRLLGLGLGAAESELERGQVSSIFDMKYKEHPQAAYREVSPLRHFPAEVRRSPEVPSSAWISALAFGLFQALPS